MRYTHEEARKEMETYVEKMKLGFPEDAYKIQCAWEGVLEGYEDSMNKDSYEEGYEEGYDKGYADCDSEWKSEYRSDE